MVQCPGLARGRETPARLSRAARRVARRAAWRRLGLSSFFFFAAATWLESSSLEDSSLEDSSARGLLVELVFAAIAAFTESVRFTEVGVFRLDLSPAPPSNCSLVFLRLWSIFFCAAEAAGSGGAVALPERVPLEGAK